MTIMYNGQPLILSNGANGGDSVPVATVISYLGFAAPEGYLICDGSEYPISQYPALAKCFSSQFGSSNYFGGDGASTFAVPDFRNLFLRGYHGDAPTELSGALGRLQAATIHPNIMTAVFNNVHGIGAFDDDGSVRGSNPDTFTNPSEMKVNKVNTEPQVRTSTYPKNYTSRPVNAAVLYCIKAFDASARGQTSGETYSEEETVIGTWIDGKPLYQKVIATALPSTSVTSQSISLAELDIEEVVSVSAMALRSTSSNKGVLPIQTTSGDAYIRYGMFASPTALQFQRTKAGTMATDSWAEAAVTAVVKYTKTTD